MMTEVESDVSGMDDFAEGEADVATLCHASCEHVVARQHHPVWSDADVERRHLDLTVNRYQRIVQVRKRRSAVRIPFHGFRN
jgi:hypothetical protein